MNYWLFKSEPEDFSIEDLERQKKTAWEGVRNYQARNFMRDICRKGDLVLFYHSSCKVPGVVGLAEISKEAFPDPSQFDTKSPYFDPRSKTEKPLWRCVEVEFKERFTQTLALSKIKENERLKGMELLKKGSRLSIQPVKEKEFEELIRMAKVQ